MDALLSFLPDNPIPRKAVPYIALAVAALLVWKGGNAEALDFMKIENARRHALSDDKIDVQKLVELIDQVERVRRVTWRMGVMGSLILFAMLYGSNVVEMINMVPCVLLSWIAITAVLNFRAFHVEDEATIVLRKYLGIQLDSDRA